MGTNWNQQPREVVEQAAGNGNTEAQAALKLQDDIDRLEANVGALRSALNAAFDDIHRRLEELRRALR